METVACTLTCGD